MSIITIGVDLAKSMFSVYELDGFDHVLWRQDLRRELLGLWEAKLRFIVSAKGWTTGQTTPGENQTN